MNACKQLLIKIVALKTNGLAALLMLLLVTHLTVSCAGTPRDDLAAAEGDAEQICLRIMITGTNIPRQECRSKAAWDALAESDREIASEYFRQTGQRSGLMEPTESASPFD